MALLESGARAVGSASGMVLAAATRTVAVLRPAAKPLHPHGDVVGGRIFRRGARPATGIAWLDEPGEDDVVVRRSRAVGLPGSMPDIHGLAVRVPRADGGYGDILFATTGWGRLTRFLLTPSRRPESRPMTTLLPYQTESGPLLLGARATGEDCFELAVAAADGDWTAFADLRLSAVPGEDQDISFDPVVNRLPGLEQYPLVERLREPSYDTARSSREE